MFRRFFGGSGGADPRWAWLDDRSGTCACCGEAMENVLSLAYHRPDPYPSDEKLGNAALLDQDGDILTEDFCRMGEHRMIRCITEFPLVGRPEVLLLGVWGSLSAGNFDRMVEEFDVGQQGELGEMKSWLCNRIPPLPGPMPSVACRITPQNGRQRPVLSVANPDDPLFALQRDGLDFDTAAAWLAAFGHDIRRRPEA